MALKMNFLVENFQKITVALKMNVLVENLQIPFFYFKEKSQKRKFEIKNLNNIFQALKFRQFLFYLDWEIHKKLSFSSLYAFKKLKNTFFHLGARSGGYPGHADRPVRWSALRIWEGGGRPGGRAAQGDLWQYSRSLQVSSANLKHTMSMATLK